MSGLRIFKSSEMVSDRATTDDGFAELQRVVGPETTGSELAGGMASATDSGFDWTLPYDEILFVIEPPPIGDGRRAGGVSL